jgi:uncharacterized membrane protein
MRVTSGLLRSSEDVPITFEGYNTLFFSEASELDRTEKKDITHSTIVNLDRLVFLIDGVFAITLTLLVLDLRPPETGNLSHGLVRMLPRLAVYLVAFYAIANEWVIHARTFRTVTSADSTLAWLSIANLLFVTLLPATTALIGRYPFEPSAAACFSANHFFMSLSVAAVWSYVARKRKALAPHADPRLARGMASVWLYSSFGFLAAIPLGYLSTYVAGALWVFWPYLVTTWWFKVRRKINTRHST